MVVGELFPSDVVALFRQNLDGKLVDCNDACAHVLGYANAADLLASGALDYVNRSDAAAVAAALGDLGRLSNVEVAIRRRDGSVAWVLQNLIVTGPEDGDQHVNVAMFDVTEQRIASQRLEHQAYHDSVTGLPNRLLFVDRANVALAQARRRGNVVAIMAVEIDDFTALTNRHGRGVADRLLRSVGERILGVVREDDSGARLEGDDFVVLLAGMPFASDAAIAATRLKDTLAEPFHIGSEIVKVTPSIGIAVARTDGDEVETLVRHASAAAARTREQGGNGFRFYEQDLDARSLERVAMVARLRNAVDEGELELHYQPEVNMQTGSIECIEALLRWRHPDLGLIPCASFLPAAEQGGLLTKLTEIVVEKAFRQLRAWHDAGHSQMRIAVNLSGNQMSDRSIPSLLDAAAGEFGIARSHVEVEFPENALANRDIHEVLRALKEYELLLAIDDFGTGGCSIADLRTLPVDTIKIAPMFVRNMVGRADDAAIVQAMVTMARALNLRVVAEGVETKEQLTQLFNRRCTEMQGYFVARPAPASGLEEILRMQQH